MTKMRVNTFLLIIMGCIFLILSYRNLSYRQYPNKSKEMERCRTMDVVMHNLCMDFQKLKSMKCLEMVFIKQPIKITTVTKLLRY